ncbi:MAG: hypothetical protein WC023_04980 [Rhodocyclaceae bacterium]|jgi:hypothetical protein
MNYAERFTDAELERILEEATIYMCACPAQVAVAIRQLRTLYRYQVACLEDAGNLALVHQTIAESAVKAHEELQDCLDRVLDLEQWDRTTLCMPEGLRRKQLDTLFREDQ